MNYPENTLTPQQLILDWYCINCNEVWQVECNKDLDMVDPINECDTVCPRCNNINTELE